MSELQTIIDQLETYLSRKANPNRDVSYIGSGDERTPVYHIQGTDPGPTAAVIGGIHGDEEAGYIVAARLANRVPLWGNLIVIPRAYRPAVASRSRSHDYDLNRQFPSDVDPENLDDLPRDIVNTVVDADVVLDLHTGSGIRGDGEGGVGQAIYSTPGANHEGESAMERFNRRHVWLERWDRNLKLTHTANQDGSGMDSLVRYLGARHKQAHLVEITRSPIPVKVRVQWMTFLVNELLEAHGVVIE